MTTRILIPVKPLKYGKSRLTGILPEHERIQLNEFLLLNTLTVIRQVVPAKDVIVISRDERVLMIAGNEGMEKCLEIGEGGLNQALYQANNRMNKNQDGVLVLPTDLPLMTDGDVQELIGYGETKPIVAVVPDRNELGTNALLVYPVGSIPYRFGDHSFHKHIASAKKRGIPVEVRKMTNLAVDLDEPEDLEILKSRGFIIPVLAIKSMEETVL